MGHYFFWLLHLDCKFKPDKKEPDHGPAILSFVLYSSISAHSTALSLAAA